jgi:hypothetical protein
MAAIFELHQLFRTWNSWSETGKPPTVDQHPSSKDPNFGTAQDGDSNRDNDEPKAKQNGKNLVA